jgi:hypothetical protein
MIYRSNLRAPDLSVFFKLRKSPLQALGHDIPSDPQYDPNCGYWSHDEAAILFAVASRKRGHWVDVGSRFGWTTAHILAAGNFVTAVDHCYTEKHLEQRFKDNLQSMGAIQLLIFPAKSAYLWASNPGVLFDGAVIDGDHDSPQPLLDAQGVVKHGAEVVLFHDFLGKPIQDAVTWMQNEGFKSRVYWTPAGVALCWRGDFQPPDHRPDPRVDWEEIKGRMDFDFGRCE